MKIKPILTKIKESQEIDVQLVSELYTLARTSLVVLFLLVVLIATVLREAFPVQITIWAIILNIFIIMRMYTVYKFKQNKNLYSLKTWYKIFLVLSLLTATIASSLGYYFIYYFDAYHQLFVVTALLGMASGSIVSLRPDTRIAIAYISIIILPLIISLNFVALGAKTHALAFILVLYCIGPISMFLKTYAENRQYKEAKAESTILKNIFKEAPLGIFSYDKNLNILEANNEFFNIFNRSKKSYKHLNLRNLSDKRPIDNIIKTITKGAQTYNGPYTSLDQKDYWIHMNTFPFSNGDNVTIGGIGLIEDKSNEHDAQKKLEFQSKHDSLTLLLNRRGFMDYIKELVNDENHHSYYSLLFYLDLDQFKGINDSLGHAMGDKILLAISGRLLGALDEKATISRLGGDEFIIIVPYVASDKKIAKENAHTYTKILQNIFEQYFIIDDIHLYIKSSIGIVIIEPNYMDTEEIVRQADMSMYQAKNTNTDVAFYNIEMDKKQKELFALQHDLAFASQNNEFDLFYQPIVDLVDSKLYSAEMLIRWKHPTRGVLRPDEFIPLTIKAGILSKITWWLLERVCEQIVEWKKNNLWKLEYISINVNAQQLVENNFAQKFIRILESHGLNTKDIMIEITEQSIIDSFSYAQDVIDALHTNGIRCAIDDFGTGYSSLSYLKKLSFDTLKIDREFIKDIQENSEESTFLTSILDVGKHFNYNIIIEGVETEGQRDTLLSLGHNLRFQGYLVAKPLKSDEFTKKFLH